MIAIEKHVAILVPQGLQNEAADICGDNFVKGASGVIYKSSWSLYTAENSETHLNITSDQLPAFASQLPTLGKSVAISGIENPEAFLSAFGMVRCDENGNELMGDVI